VNSDQAPPPAPPPRRRSFPRLLLVAAFLLVGLPLVLLAGIYLILLTEPGRSGLASLIESSVSQPDGLQLEIGRLEGPLPQRIVLYDVRLADPDGDLLTLDRALLTWHPLDLFQRRVNITALEAGEVALYRLPEGADEEPPPDSSEAFKLELPELPVSINLERLHVQELFLAESLAGAEARLTIDGFAKIERDGGLEAALSVERIDERPGNLEVELALAPGGEHLTARVKGSEPAGGLLAELLDLPGRPPVQLSLDGDGPPDGWLAHLLVDASEAAQLTADIKLDGLQPLDLSFSGEARAEALLPEELQPLLADGLRFEAKVQQDSAGATEFQDLHLVTGVAELQGSGRLEADGETLEAKLTIDVENGQPLAGLTSPVSFGQAQLSLTLGGRLSAPTAELHTELHDFWAPQAHLNLLMLEATATTAQPLNEADAAVSAALTLSGEGLHLDDDSLAQAVPGDPRLTAQGVYRLKQQHLTLDHLEASLAELLLQLSGEVTLPEAEGQLPVGQLTLTAAHGNLSSLAALARSDLRGSLSVDAEVTLHEDGAVEGNLNAMANRLHLGDPVADAMLGERPGLVARLHRAQDDHLHLEELRLDTSTSFLTAEALIAADYSEIDAVYHLGISALEPLGEALQQPLGGSLQVEGTAVGRLTAPHIRASLEGQDLSLPGDPARRLSAELDVDLADPGPLGSFTLEGSEGRYGPLSSDAVFALADEVLFLEPFRFNLGKAASITGHLQWPLDGQPGSGRVDGEIPRLDAIAALAGMEAAGSLGFHAELLPQDGQQALQANAQLDRLRLGPASNPSLQVQQAELTAQADDLLGSLGVDAALTASNLTAADITLGQGRLTATGDLSALAVRLAAQGSANDEPLQLQSEATLGIEGDHTRLSLTLLEVDWAEEEIRLLAPAEVAIAPDDLHLQRLQLAVLGGRLEGTLHQQGQSIEGALELSGLPLARLAELAGNGDVEGNLSAQLALSGSMASPQAQLRVQAQDLVFAAEADLTSRPAMVFRAEASLTPDRLNVDALAEGFAETPLTLAAALPVRASLAPFVMEVVSSQPLEAHIHWEGQLEPIIALLPTDSIRLVGEGLIDLRASGSLDSPQLGGEVVISRARYENYTSGTVLQQMEIVLSGADRRLTLERLEAGDGAAGRIDGSGSLTWLGEEGIEADMHVRFDNMLIAQRDDVTARISGGIDVVGNLLQDALVSGRLTNDFIEIRLVDALPPSVAEIDVIEVHDGVPAREEEELSAEAPPPSPIALDVEIDLPRRVFVRGRGLESEWRGRFLVNGRANNPQISGEINPVRGSFTVVGKTFVLQESSIRLPAGAPSLDPELDLTAVYSTSDFRALIYVTGAASHPQIELSSEPELPEDEILSRVLFNKNSANLTAVEAIELADAAASLATGGPGITGFMRRALGVDQFGFRPGATEDDPGSVAIGTYLGDGVYVGVEQGMRPGSTGVTVEIDITDSIKAHSDFGADGRSRSGIRWQMDY